MKTLLQAQFRDVFPNGVRTKRDFNDAIERFRYINLIYHRFIRSRGRKQAKKRKSGNGCGKSRERIARMAADVDKTWRNNETSRKEVRETGDIQV